MKCTFLIYVDVDPTVVAWSQDRADDRTPLEVVSDEIESNLHSVPYVKSTSIKGVVNEPLTPTTNESMQNVSQGGTRKRLSHSNTPG
jgi:hypothetical protein